MARRTVASVCEEFANKAAKGPATLSVAPDLAIEVALELVRLGFKVADDILDGVPDEDGQAHTQNRLVRDCRRRRACAAIGRSRTRRPCRRADRREGRRGRGRGGAIGAAVATTVMVRRELGPKGQPRILFTAG
jgi:hypothetical protein